MALYSLLQKRQNMLAYVRPAALTHKGLIWEETPGWLIAKA